jgi:flagellin-like protein
MKLKQFFTDDDAVSPVIGVILMVAITVILAAVIASFVLGLGDSTQTTPSASFDFDYQQGDSSTDDTFSTGTTGDGILIITHESGDSIDATQIDITGSSETASNSMNLVDDGSFTSSDEISAGTEFSVRMNDGDSIRVVYTGESGDSSSTLQTFEGPDA